MQSYRPLYWRHGQFLSPQHFQQLDRFHLGLQRYFWQLREPYGWGVRKLRVREEGLAAGLFDVLEAEAVLRDGTVVAAGPEASHPNARLQQRQFLPFIDAADRPIGVYLGVPRLAPGQRNIGHADSTAQRAELTRFRLAELEVGDQFVPDVPAAGVQFVEYQGFLLFDREENFAQVSQGMDLVKLADLVPLESMTGARLSDEYVPPLLAIAGSDPLMRRLLGLRDLFVSKSSEFDALRRQRGVRASASSLQELLRLQMLLSLSRYAPALAHVADERHLHPEPVYGLLRQIVGELSAYVEDVTVLGGEPGDQAGVSELPAYDHEDIWGRFNRAIGLIHRLVRSMTMGPEMGIQLEFDGTYYAAKLPEDFFKGDRARFYLMIDSKFAGPALWELLQRTGKISMMEDMPQLRRSHLFGLKIDHLPVPPEELPYRSSRYSYFQIDGNSPLWGRIRDKGNIALLADLDPATTQIRILKVLPE